MWLIPFSPGLDHVVTIHFNKAESIAGLRFWNYNKSPEDTYRGVRRGTAAALRPLSGRGRLDGWLAWLPERGINPPELSKWSWGVTARERVCCSSLLQTANAGWSPGQTRETTSPCSFQGFKGAEQAQPPTHSGSCSLAR